MGVFLLHREVIYEVHITLLGNTQRHLAHVERTVLQDIEVTTETEVLRVVGRELQMIARVALHSHGVCYIIAVEGNGIVSDRRCKGILQQPDVIVIDVHIRKYIFNSNVKYITRLKELVYALTRLSHHDMLFAFGILAIEMARDGLVDIQRQDILLCVR